MAYYGMGDYYRPRGDYYRGDPFLGSLAAAAGRALLPIAARAVGRVAGTVARVVRRPGVVPVAAGVAVARAVRPPPPGQERVPGFGGIAQRFLPFGKTGFQDIRRKRMNPANPKALRRALRRISGFAKLAQRAKREIARANAAVGNKSGRRGGVSTVTVNPTAARVRNV